MTDRSEARRRSIASQDLQRLGRLQPRTLRPSFDAQLLPRADGGRGGGEEHKCEGRRGLKKETQRGRKGKDREQGMVGRDEETLGKLVMVLFLFNLI